MLYRTQVFVLCFLFITLLSCRHNNENNIDNACSATIKAFFNNIRNGEYVNGLDSLLLSNKNIDFTDSATSKLRDGFKNMNELSGKYVGYKLLKKRIIIDDIAAYSYLIKYEKKFYRLIFIFYKPISKVSIYKFAYDDILDLELEESLKLYN